MTGTDDGAAMAEPNRADPPIPPTPPGLTVLTGGARSGKSRLALELAGSAPATEHDPGWSVVFVATCPRIEGDTDLDRRIEAHRAERPPTWTTREVELDLADALASTDPAAVVIVDCLTLWVNNRLFAGDDEAAVVRASAEAIDAARARRGPTIVVTNEVGLGIIPADPPTRAYRDALGRVNQGWVAAADRALLLVAGRAVALRDPRELW